MSVTNINLSTSSVQIKMDNINKGLSKRGLTAKVVVQRVFTNECARYMDKYIPMSQGAGVHMKNMKNVEVDSVTYAGPYARYQWGGKVMIGPAPKRVTNIDLKYNGAPVRGAHFEEKMWEDRQSVG